MEKEKKKLFELTQVPVLEYKFEELGETIKKMVSKYENLIITEDTRKDIKKSKATLTKKLKEFEQERKEIKNKVLAPYSQFEELYKSNVSLPMKNVIDDFTMQINHLEEQLKKEKERELLQFFVNFVKANPTVNFIKYSDLNINVTLSASLKKLKEEVEEKMTNYLSDIYTIAQMEDEIKIMAIYKDNLNLTKSIAMVEDMKKKEEEARIKKEERLKREAELKKVELEKKEEVKPVEVPKVAKKRVVEVIDTREEKKVVEVKKEVVEKKANVMTVKFEVTGEVEKLKKLANYIKELGLSSKAI